MTVEADPSRFGDYRIERRLGRGGMGEVFLAWDERLGRHVAIKRIVTDPPPDEAARCRFRREARAVARLSHPSIVQVFDWVESDVGDGLVMEYVEGDELIERIAGGRLDLGQALRLASEIAEGLAAAHGSGLIHRDLKPENIRITPDGHAKILDFGLTRLLWDRDLGETGEAAEPLTLDGALVGTVHAMSPEQAGGRSVDHRADLFALGGVVYEMLIGRAPFRGDNVLDTLRRITSEDPPPLAELWPGVPPRLAELVGRLLAKDPADRPPNARLVADAFDRLRLDTADRATEPVGCRAATEPDPPSPPSPSAAKSAELPTGGWPALGSDGTTETVVRTLWVGELVGRRELYETLGDWRATEVVGELTRTLRELSASHGGIEVAHGEQSVILFDAPAAAVEMSVDLHRRLADHSVASGVELRLGVGVHLGEMQLRTHPAAEVARGAGPLEVEGAARLLAIGLAGLAAPRQTLVSQEAFEVARRADGAARDDRCRWLVHGAYRLHDAEQPVGVCEVGEVDLAPLSPPADSATAKRCRAQPDDAVLGWRPAIGEAIPKRPTWRLVDRLGEGGFGEVWLARHASGEQRVFKFCFDAARLRASRREVTLLRVLRDALGDRDDMVRVFDWNLDSMPYFVELEHSASGDLGRWAERHELARLPLADRLEWVAQVAEALAAAHAVGVLHRDLQPANLLVVEAGEGRSRLRLADFGVGALVEPSRLGSRGVAALGVTATLEEPEAGSPRYLAPEILEGRPASVAADLYALGALLYQLALGDLNRALADGWQREIGDPLIVSEIERLVDGDPGRRPASAAEVATRLRTLDARRQRQQRDAAASARRRRWRLVARAALIVWLAVSVLWLQAWSERRQAEALQHRAEAARGEAEELIAFLLGDLRPELQAIGRLDALEGVGEKALAYFAELAPEDVTPPTLARHAEALHHMGDVRMAQGDLDGALRLFERAAERNEAWLAAEPTDLDALFALGQSRFWVGNVFYRQQDWDAARVEMQAYLDLSERLNERRDDDASLLEVAYGHNNVGATWMQLGDAPRAAEHYRRALDISRRLLDRDPAAPDRRARWINAVLRLGDLHEAQGEPRAAAERYAEALDASRSAGDPSVEEAGVGDAGVADATALRQRSLLLDRHARTALALGDVDTASAARRRQVELLERLLALDGSHAEWRVLAGFALADQAEVAIWRGDADQALDLLDRSAAWIDPEAGDPTSRSGWRHRIGLLRAEALFRLGRPASARQALDGATRDEDEVGSLPRIDARLLAGRLRDAAGDREAAVAIWADAWALVESSALPPKDYAALDRRARTLLVMGHVDRARAPVYTLLGMGYRHPRFIELCHRTAPTLCDV